MTAEDFKEKAAACAGDCDVYELCVTYLRRQAKSDQQPVALKAMDIYEEVMA
jgi:hypothetical protein